MAKNPESPLEPFKRALVNATRSLAESPDLEIVYSGEGPQLSGNRAVLPHPPRDLTSIDAARIRGFADQMTTCWTPGTTTWPTRTMAVASC